MSQHQATHNRPRSVRSAAAAALVSAAAAVGLQVVAVTGASAASPALVTMSQTSLGASLSYVAGPSTVNTPRVLVQNGLVTITDSAVLTAGTGCTTETSTRVTCGTRINQINLQLGDLDDSSRVDVQAAGQVLGGAGADTFTAGLTGSGRFTYNGGADLDTVSYSLAPSAVKVSMDGLANDGRLIGSAGVDNVQDDVERVIGSGFADTLLGDERRNEFLGLGGNDTFAPGAGVDRLFGSSGNDSFSLRDGFVDVADGGPDTDVATVDRSFDSVTTVETIS